MRTAKQVIKVAGLVILILIFSLCDLFKNKSVNDGSDLPDPIDPGAIGTLDSLSLKILFIGNSLTYYNDQPHLFWYMANSVGKNLYVDQATIPGAQMLDHLGSDFTKKKIELQKWDLVILQEAIDAIAFSENHEEVIACLQQMKTLILENYSGTKIAYFLPWSLKQGYQRGFQSYDFETFQTMLRDGTVAVSKNMDFVVAPIGWAWFQVIQERPEIQLYDMDGSHPSFVGSYLGACVYFVMIFQESVVDNPFSVLINKDHANYLQETATRTVMDSLSYWNIPPRKIPGNAMD
ncbi:MAG: hypothetical protein MUC94_16070 [bacterium]|nr:hypothetical protein [bacterium]